jgi:hypothetical protein
MSVVYKLFHNDNIREFGKYNSNGNVVINNSIDPQNKGECKLHSLKRCAMP